VLVTRAQIAHLIPHGDPMCLLDGVLQWDASRIVCVSRNHRAADNPMRANGLLPAVCGVEYAAQAMAVHGGLAGKLTRKPRAGYLASLREVECLRDRLDDLDGDLVVEAERLAGDGAHVIYRFRLRVGDVEVLSGQALVALDALGAPSLTPSPSPERRGEKDSGEWSVDHSPKDTMA
jgi:predicted hotdog family 3-hydroxylacyl-ACP dehydratase